MGRCVALERALPPIAPGHEAGCAGRRQSPIKLGARRVFEREPRRPIFEFDPPAPARTSAAGEQRPARQTHRCLLPIVPAHPSRPAASLSNTIQSPANPGPTPISARPATPRSNERERTAGQRPMRQQRTGILTFSGMLNTFPERRQARRIGVAGSSRRNKVENAPAPPRRTPPLRGGHPTKHLVRLTAGRGNTNKGPSVGRLAQR